MITEFHVSFDANSANLRKDALIHFKKQFLPARSSEQNFIYKKKQFHLYFLLSGMVYIFVTNFYLTKSFPSSMATTKTFLFVNC